MPVENTVTRYWKKRIVTATVYRKGAELQMQRTQEYEKRYYYRKHPMTVLALFLTAGLILLMPVLEAIPSAFAEQEGQRLTVCGTVRESRDGTSYLWLQVDDTKEVLYISLPGEWGKDNSRIYYPSGSRLQIAGVLEKPEGQRNPGGIDEAKWLLSKKARMKLKAEEIRILEKPQGIWKISWLVQYRLKATAEYYLTDEENHLAIALLLGEKQHLDESFYRMTQRMGIAHIFAVSGLHVGFAGALLLFVFRVFHRERSWISFLLLTAGLGFYCILTGLAPSAVRAALMIILATVAMRLLRPPAPVDFLALAAIVLLADNPFLMYNAGFQLSFGVTLCLLLFVRPLQEKLRFIKWMWLRGSAAVALAASLGSIPLSAWHFYTISMFAPFYNLFLVPLVSVLVPLLLIASLAAFIVPFAGVLFFFPVKQLLNMLLWGTSCLADLFGTGHYYTGRPGWMAYGFYLLFLYFLWNWLTSERHKERQGVNRKLWMRNGSVIFLLAVLLCSFPYPPAQDELLYLDAGQGSCALLRTEAGETVIFDGGAQKGELASVLAWYGINEVNAIVLSHGDDDHTGGLQQILESVPVKYLCVEKTQAQRETMKPLLKAAQKNKTAVKPVEYGGMLALKNGTIQMQIIDDGGVETNSRELAAALHLGDCTVLFPGDLSAAGVKEFIKEQQNITIWTVPHHGSRFSASEEIYALLKQKGAQLAVVSAGKNNRYGHPSGEVLEYLRTNRIALCRTDQEGAVQVKLDETGDKTYRVQLFMKKSKRLYQFREKILTIL